MLLEKCTRESINNAVHSSPSRVHVSGTPSRDAVRENATSPSPPYKPTYKPIPSLTPISNFRADPQAARPPPLPLLLHSQPRLLLPSCLPPSSNPSCSIPRTKARARNPASDTPEHAPHASRLCPLGSNTTAVSDKSLPEPFVLQRPPRPELCWAADIECHNPFSGVAPCSPDRISTVVVCVVVWPSNGFLREDEKQTTTIRRYSQLLILVLTYTGTLLYLSVLSLTKDLWFLRSGAHLASSYKFRCDCVATTTGYYQTYILKPNNMATTMATTRQPFGPVDSSRLQTLTSLKNRQNGMLTSLQYQFHVPIPLTSSIRLTSASSSLSIHVAHLSSSLHPLRH